MLARHEEQRRRRLLLWIEHLGLLLRAHQHLLLLEKVVLLLLLQHLGCHPLLGHLGRHLLVDHIQLHLLRGQVALLVDSWDRFGALRAHPSRTHLVLNLLRRETAWRPQTATDWLSWRTLELATQLCHVHGLLL